MFPSRSGGVVSGYTLGFGKMQKGTFDQYKIVHDIKQNLFPVLHVSEVGKSL